MLKNFSHVEKPKISLVITLYNQKEFILKIYSCILNQFLKDIEIIFMDDGSIDNPFIIIEKLMIKDKRIRFLKKKKNRGQFYSRNSGVLYCRGEYVIIIDPDDLLLNDILIKAYNLAKKFNLDIVQFYHLMGDYKKDIPIIINKKHGLIYGNETKNLFFDYGTRYLWDKLIRRSIFRKSIYFMKKNIEKRDLLYIMMNLFVLEFLNQHIHMDK